MAQDYKRDADLATRQLDYEQQRYQELEQVVARERRQMQTDGSQLRRFEHENVELKEECNRLKLRCEILNQHIDSLQRCGGAGSVDNSLDQSKVMEMEDQVNRLNQDLDAVIRENEGLKDKIRDLETEVHGN
jgi:predicted RNase H-like nuclease (RuvC/YqgF family)